MVTLEDLPNETLIEIISHLRGNALVSVSCVSRRLNAVSQASIYRAPCLTITNMNNRRSLRSFLRTLLLAPDREIRASYVRSLTLNWNNFGVKYPSHPRPYSEDIALIAATASDFGIFHPLLALEGVQLLLILHLLPNLRLLDLGLPCVHDTFSDMMKAYFELQSGGLPNGLKSLRRFRCDWNGDVGVSPHTLRTVMMLPSIHAIDLPIVEGFSRPYPGAGTSTVKTIRFSNADLTPAELTPILLATRALTHFSYYCSYTDHTFDFVAFGIAMQPLRNSLKYLRLDFGAVALPRWTNAEQEAAANEDPVVNNIGSLRDWPMLRTVRCSPRALLDTPQHELPSLSEVLPLGIHELEILDDSYWSTTLVVLQVVDLLLRKELVATSLRKLAIRSPRVPRIKQLLASACQVAAVELVKNTPFV